MFRREGSKIIESQENFAVELLGRWGMHYYEGDRVMDIQAELGVSSIGIWSNSIRKWNPPHDQDFIDDTKRDAIISSIRRAYQWAGEELYVVDRIG